MVLLLNSGENEEVIYWENEEESGVWRREPGVDRGE